MSFNHQMKRVPTQFQPKTSYISVSSAKHVMNKTGIYILQPQHKNQVIEVEAPGTIYISPNIDTSVAENIFIRCKKPSVFINMKNGSSKYTKHNDEYLESRLKIIKSDNGLEYCQNFIEISLVEDIYLHKIYGNWI
tara:strand:- start:1104 stop:1511 length:408 start_codon:yes stop_codon:yes gene_type:complete